MLNNDITANKIIFVPFLALLVALVVPLVPMVDHGNTIGTNGLLVALVLTYIPKIYRKKVLCEQTMLF